MRYIRPLLAALCIFAFLLLTACSGIDAGVEGLMLPPKLTSEQSGLYSALETAAGTENIRLRYPKSGSGNSAFIFEDIDSDEAMEAVVFYSTQDSSATRMNILRKVSGRWVSVYDMKGRDSDVVSVEFASAKSGTMMVIGWRNQISGQKTLTVYRFSGNVLRDELSVPYQESAICRISGGEHDDIVVFAAANEAGETTVSLLGLDGDSPREISRTRLALGAADYLAVTPGTANGGARALYVDYSTGDGRYSSDVIYFRGELRSYFSGSGELPLRYDEITSEDVDDDGVPEIPVQQETEDNASGIEDAVYVTQYLSAAGPKPQTVMTAVINQRDGYLFELPANWIDGIDVKKNGESGEWRFFEAAEDGRSGVELLRIRTVNKNTYHDKFDESYKLIAERGVNQYYMFLPVSDSPLGLTLSECINRFRLRSVS